MFFYSAFFLTPPWFWGSKIVFQAPADSHDSVSWNFINSFMELSSSGGKLNKAGNKHLITHQQFHEEKSQYFNFRREKHN